MPSCTWTNWSVPDNEEDFTLALRQVQWHCPDVRQLRLDNVRLGFSLFQVLIDNDALWPGLRSLDLGKVRFARESGHAKAVRAKLLLLETLRRPTLRVTGGFFVGDEVVYDVHAKDDA